VHIMETKGMLCNLFVGRRADNAAQLGEYRTIAEGKIG
jgi:hypothetical protein